MFLLQHRHTSTYSRQSYTFTSLSIRNYTLHNKKSTKLKELIQSKELNFIMEAHSGISAKIVEETGFKGIWASGLAISASLGVRDCNEASWTQVLEVVEFMSDCTKVPILVDGDTGYGNFNNARRLVRKLEQRGIAGVCIEDKLFPKTNSFVSDDQPLADINEFSGKISAMKASQTDPDFQVVARVEALICGRGMDEAFRRAEAYQAAGADAILIHSKKKDISEVAQFAQHWNRRHPLVVVPTKYYNTPTEVFRGLGINLVIWANHNLRASMMAMKDICQKLYEQETLMFIEKSIPSVEEIFRLQNEEELRIAEEKYLPPKK